MIGAFHCKMKGYNFWYRVILHVQGILHVQVLILDFNNPDLYNQINIKNSENMIRGR